MPVDSNTAIDVDMLRYFWEQKHDVKRYIGYEHWKASHHTQAGILEGKLEQVEIAEKGVSCYINSLYETIKT